MIILRISAILGLVIVALCVLAYMLTGHAWFKQTAIKVCVFCAVLFILTLGLLALERVFIPLGW